MSAVPPEPPMERSLDVLAPAFRRKLEIVLANLEHAGLQPEVNETLRTNERQSWLYGMGRDYDDGRGVVTNAPDVTSTWHGYGLAADICDGAHGWDSTPDSFWEALAAAVHAEGLTSGSEWHHRDLPHVQWHCDGMRVSPSPHAADLQERGGNALVWHALQADV